MPIPETSSMILSSMPSTPPPPPPASTTATATAATATLWMQLRVWNHQHGLFWRVAVILFAGALVFLFQTEDAIWLDHRHSTSSSLSGHSDLPIPSRCWDSDEPEAWSRPMEGMSSSSSSGTTGSSWFFRQFASSACQCPDPTIATPRKSSRDKVIWNSHHAMMVYDAIHSRPNLDFVLIGDSITERFNGTRGMGKAVMPDYHQIFIRHFHIDAGGDLEGIALGSSGDTTTELLWHIQNGIISDNLHPKVWVILVGTNDIGRYGCSTETVYAGILAIAEYIEQVRPGVPILIHGLLPRSDLYDAIPIDYSLGRMWRKIVRINQRLNDYVNSIDREWHYIESNRLFVQKVRPTKSKNGGVAATAAGTGTAARTQNAAFEINPHLMTDALHPNLEGYEKWAERLSTQILNRIQHG